MKLSREALIGHLLDASMWNLYEAYHADNAGQVEQAQAYRARGEMARELVHNLTDPQTRTIDL